MEKKKSLWEQMGRDTGSSDEEKKKKEKKSNGLWSKIKSKFKGPSASEAATGVAKRMKNEEDRLQPSSFNKFFRWKH